MNKKEHKRNMNRKEYKHKWYEKHKRKIKDDQHIEHCSYNYLVHIGKTIKKRLSESSDINSYSNYYDDINNIPRRK